MAEKRALHIIMGELFRRVINGNFVFGSGDGCCIVVVGTFPVPPVPAVDVAARKSFDADLPEVIGESR